MLHRLAASRGCRLAGLLGSVLALPAHAAEPSAPASAPGAPVRVWYRSSDGCPDGGSFVERLRQLGRPAALAGVGDRVDFVVTLAARADVSAGRLERQTERGTVAIREVESAACADVAEALALSLELALEPAGGAPASHTAQIDTAPHDTARSGDGAAAALPPSVAAGLSSRAPPDASEPDRAAGSPATAPGGSLGLGAQGRLGLGLSPAVLPGAALFAELARERWPAAVRFSLHGAYGESEVRATRIALLLLGGELDVCGWRWHAGALSLEPCLGADVGLLQASGAGQRAREDRGLWASARALLRSRLALSAELQPELQLGLLLPFTRYAFGAPEGDALFRMRAVAGELSVGARWAP